MNRCLELVHLHVSRTGTGFSFQEQDMNTKARSLPKAEILFPGLYRYANLPPIVGRKIFAQYRCYKRGLGKWFNSKICEHLTSSSPQKRTVESWKRESCTIDSSQNRMIEVHNIKLSKGQLSSLYCHKPEVDKHRLPLNHEFTSWSSKDGMHKLITNRSC